MSLTIITGPAQAGKTQACIETLGRDPSREILLVCSTTYLADSLGRRLALDHTQQVATTTFDLLRTKLWRLHGDRRALVEPFIREAVVDEIRGRPDARARHKSLQTTGGRRFLVELVRSCVPSSLPDADRGRSWLRDLITACHDRLDEEGLIEQEAALFELARREVLPAATGVAFLGFTDLTLSQRAYIKMLAAHVEVALAVTHEDSGEATEEGRAFAASLELLGNDIDTVALPAPPTEFSLLRSRFLGEQEEEGRLTKADIEFLPVQGEDTEISQAAAAVKDALAQQCSKVSETTDDAPVALVLRHLASKADQVSRAMEALDIPVDFDLKVPLRQSGLGSALLGLLLIPQSRTELVARASGYGLSVYSGLSREVASDLDRWLREDSPGYSCKLCDELGVPLLHEMTAQDWADQATAMLMRSLSVKRSDFRRQLDFAAHKTFLSALAQLQDKAERAGVSGDAPLDPAEISASIESARIDLTPRPGSRQVLIAEASRVRGRQFHTVVLAGLAAQDFSVGVEPSPVERAAAQLTGQEPPDKIAGEYQLFYDLLGCARARLVVIAQTRDLAGQRLAPSVLLEELLLLCGKKEEWEQATPAIAGAAPAGAPPLAAPARGELTGLDFGQDGRAPFAITTLESYIRCPYSWFLSRFTVRKVIDDDTATRDEGMILHEALRLFYVRAREELGSARLRADLMDKARVLADRCFDEACEKVVRVPSGADAPEALRAPLAALRHALQSFLQTEADWLPGFTPREFERSFGNDADHEAPQLGGVPLRGRIDRVDVLDAPSPEDPDERRPLIVIDYKRKNVPEWSGLDTRIRHKEIQAAAYGLVAEQLFGGLRYIGSAYRSVMDPASSRIELRWADRWRYAEELGQKRRKKPPASDELEAHNAKEEQNIADIETLIQRGAAGLRQGDARIAPLFQEDETPYAACEFAPYCLHTTCPSRKRGG